MMHLRVQNPSFLISAIWTAAIQDKYINGPAVLWCSYWRWWRWWSAVPVRPGRPPWADRAECSLCSYRCYTWHSGWWVWRSWCAAYSMHYRCSVHPETEKNPHLTASQKSRWRFMRVMEDSGEEKCPGMSTGKCLWLQQQLHNPSELHHWRTLFI